jgi:putative cell wall-binding protein
LRKRILLSIYILNFLGKVGSSDKSTQTPKDTEPEAQFPEISEPEQIVPEIPLPEISESEQTIPEVPLPEIKEPEKVVPEEFNTSMIITRLGGATRLETALEIADELRGGSKLDAVILSSANNFPDSLSGAVLTKKYNAPILLVNKTANKSKATLDYIVKNLSSSGQVVILGSSGVIDNSIIEYLKNFGFTKIKRLGGSNRFETNVSIIRDLAPTKGSDVIISSAVTFPDALSISSISAIKGIPIILTNKNNLSNEVKSLLASIEPSKIYITGEVGAISNRVRDELKKYSSDVIRLGGYDRYETSIVINNYFKSDLSGDSIILTLGLNFPDALAGITLASKYYAPILLVNPSNSNVQKYFISNNKRKNVYVLGSTGVFSKELLNYIIQ